jgi:hypothetical protein
MGPTTDRLRHDIASKEGGDKVAFPDPAAAPLGTDDEAGGHPPSPETVALAYRHEIDPAPATSTTTSELGRTISGEWTDRRGIGVAIAVAAAAVLLTAVIALLA